MFERRFAGFPKIGHFNTWLMDLLQNLVGHNHNICYCPNWSNTSEFETTPEQHGIVPLHSKVLGDAIGRRVLRLRESEERRRVPKRIDLKKWKLTVKIEYSLSSVNENDDAV